MNVRPITEEQACAISVGEHCQYEMVDDGNYEDDGNGKYQTCNKVVRDKDDGTLWMLPVTRSGSYFSEWYYEYPRELIQVEKATKTIEYWKIV